jgi:hypothetical protein
MPAFREFAGDPGGDAVGPAAEQPRGLDGEEVETGISIECFCRHSSIWSKAPDFDDERVGVDHDLGSDFRKTLGAFVTAASNAQPLPILS